MNLHIPDSDCLETSALNEQFVASLVLLRRKSSESVSEMGYANFPGYIQNKIMKG